MHLTDEKVPKDRLERATQKTRGHCTMLQMACRRVRDVTICRVRRADEAVVELFAG
jgi:hypothetical protein